jgi:hypothetical protein
MRLIMSILKKSMKTKQDDDQFNREELEFLLKTIADGVFAGKDVQTVYNLAVKIQNMLSD